MKGLGGTLLLLLVLVAIGVAFWLSRGAPAAGDDSLTVSALDGRHLMRAARIAVQNDPNGAAIEFEQDGGGRWRVVEPVRDLASVARLEAIAKAYDTAQLVHAYEKRDVTDKLLADTGLDTPLARLEVHWPDDHSIEIRIGQKGPLGRDRFAMRDGEVFRVQEALMTSLQFTPQEARDPFVFQNLPEQVERIRLTRRTDSGAQESIALSRPGGGAWTFTEPAGLRVDPERAAAFVQGLLGLRVTRFLQGRPSELVGPTGPEAPPDAVIEVEGLGGRERVVLRRDAAAGELIGESDVRDSWFAVEDRKYRAVLETPLLSLRAHWLLTLPLDETERIRIVVPGKRPIELVRRAGKTLALAQPVASRAWPTAVSELLQALRGLAVREFVEDGAHDLDRYGLGEGRTEVTLHAARWNKPDVLYVGADRGDGATFLKRADEPNVVAIETKTADVLRRPWTDYVDRGVTHIDEPSTVRAITHVHGDRTVRFVRGDDGFWHRQGETERVPIVDEINDLLVELTAKAVLPKAAWNVTDTATVRVEGLGGRVLDTLEVGPTADGGYLARTGPDAEFIYALELRDGRDLFGLE